MGVGGLSTGLSTGIDYAGLLESLLGLEEKPIKSLEEKVALNNLKQEAYDELNTQALAAKLSMFDLASLSTFEKKTVSSSNESILTATGNRLANTGSHSLQVARLASSSVNVSSGIKDADTTTLSRGQLTFELGGRRLDRSTELDDLNDGQGVQRGVVTLTDSTGRSEDIDLASAVSVTDMLNLFNANGMGLVFSTDRSIAAPPAEPSANGYSIKITNNGSSTVKLSEIGTSSTLNDLGFKTSSSKSVSAGKTSSGVSQIYYVSEGTKLNKINDGFGIITNASGTNDIRFYVKNTASNSVKAVDVDLHGAQDIGDVLNKINSAMFDAKVNQYSTARLSSDGASLEFTGTVSGFSNLNGSRAASDLGLTRMRQVGSVYKGEALIAEMGSSLIRNLRGGHGIDNLDSGTFNISSRRGDSYSVNLDRAVSISDILSKISDATANDDNQSGAFAPTSTSNGTLSDTTNIKSGSTTIETDRLIGATVMANGNAALTAVIESVDLSTGTLTFSSTNNNIGATAVVNYGILYEPLSQIRAEINEDGNGISLYDDSSGNKTFRVNDVSGNVAEQLGIDSTLAIEPVLFNPIDLSTDTAGVGRRSAVYLSKGSLPLGVTENELLGRSVENIWSSISQDNSSTPTKESARIIAFEEAPDAVNISPLETAASSTFTLSTAALATTYGGTQDRITDVTNLNKTLNTKIKSENMVGATVSVYSSTLGKVSSTIIGYDETNKHITFADNAFSAAGLDTAAIEGLGYNIEYNHKLILEHDKSPSSFTGSGTVAAQSITDAPNLITGIDSERIVGATVSVFKSGIEYTGVVESHNSGTGEITLVAATDTITGNVNSAELAANGYSISYTPIHHANYNGSNRSNFLSAHTGGHTDTISIVGVGNGEHIVGKNLENRMLSGNTRLEDLNGGKGINRGIMLISTGDASAEIDLSQTSIQTVQDLMDEVSNKFASVRIEINDRGDGLRIYDKSLSPTAGLSVTDKTGSAASDLNLLNTGLAQKKVSVSSGADFYSLQGTVAATTVDPYRTTITVAAFNDLKESEVIGSKITYTDTTNGTLAGRKVHAIVTDFYTDGSGNAILSLAGQVTETNNSATSVSDVSDGSGHTLPVGTAASTSLDGLTVNLQLKKHFSNYEHFGYLENGGNVNTASFGDGVSDTPGAFTLTLDTTSVESYANLSEEQLIGSMINFNSPKVGIDVDKVRGLNAMITNFDSATGTLTLQAAEANASIISKVDDLAKDGSMSLSISRDQAPEKFVQAGGISSTNSYLKDIASQGYVSLTATVATGSHSTTIVSDQFANLDHKDVIGSLVTIKTRTGATSDVGKVAIVTDYNEAAKTITVGNFYEYNATTGVSSNSAITLDENDEVYITYAKELKGTVIRSSDYDPPTTTDTTTTITQASANIAIAATQPTQLNMIDIGSISTIAGSEDIVIGSTITFGGSATATQAALQDESRRVVDIIHDYGDSQGKTVLVLDEALPASMAGTDTFTISFDEVTATIDEIDFSTGVISTVENMELGMGSRDFSIHQVIDGSYQKDIEVLETDTLNDLVSRINGANVGVQASVISDGSTSNPYRLSLTSKNTGDFGAVTVASNVSNFDFKLAAKGQDAKVIIGDEAGSSSVVSSSTNTVTDAIAGVTLSLGQASKEKVSLTVDHDKEGLLEKTQTVVDEVNTLLDSATKLIALETVVEVTNEDGSTKKEKQKGLLFGDSATRNMINDIKSLLTQFVEGLPAGSLNSLSDIGVRLSSDGKSFDFDTDTFNSMLSSRFDDVKELFTTNPNLAPNSSLSISSDFLQSNYNINHIRNKDSSSSGFSESGNGTNGIKLAAGSSSKYLSYTFGETKDLYGFRLHHHIPTDLTARYSVGGNTSTITSTSLTDATNLGTDKKLIADQVVGATLTVGTAQATVTGYDATTGALTYDTNADMAAATSTNGYILTTKSGENISFQHNVTLEYRDPTTNTYKTYQTYQKRTDGVMSIVFPGQLKTDSIRVRYDNNTGQSEDFTENGHYVRLMEMEILDSQGLGSKFSRSFANFTDANTGSLSLANSTLSNLNDSYSRQIERLNASLQNSADRYIKEFQNLEIVVSKLNSQNSYLQSQLGSLPTAFSYRGNNK